jgi:[CysO sulfur-carrier protein]-S-L-cysteine hydrolase
VASVRICASVLDQMLSHARAEWPLECCGLLAGRGGLIREVFPAANARASQSEFFIPPETLIETFRAIRAAGLKHLGIYHSHPQGENYPSRRDVEMAFYPSCAYFIVTPRTKKSPAIRAFSISDGDVGELTIEPVTEPSK